ncbi:hypothetical protein GIB67_018818 [Kingdonia uniflora]|uniref:Uncharacterized protein n=1 Tax=Kingdonia uniflora TaxID=39325 RepID=A0A7J7NE88_9MAGN|nr:hypothetical protein GIB67_018818 [Kingdonia uniflora]
MEKKIESLARIIAILKYVIQNKDRIIARLQQPYSLDCIPVEVEYHKQFSKLLLMAEGDYGALTALVAASNGAKTLGSHQPFGGKCSGLSPSPWHHTLSTLKPDCHERNFCYTVESESGWFLILFTINVS